MGNEDDGAAAWLQQFSKASPLAGGDDDEGPCSDPRYDLMFVQCARMLSNDGIDIVKPAQDILDALQI